MKCIFVLLLLAFALSQSCASEDIDPEGALIPVARCKACENVVKHILRVSKSDVPGEEVKLYHRNSPERNRKATTSARAHEIVDNACKATTSSAPMHQHCEETLGSIDDELVSLLIAERNPQSEDATIERMCESVCAWKAALKGAIQGTHKIAPGLIAKNFLLSLIDSPYGFFIVIGLLGITVFVLAIIWCSFSGSVKIKQQ